MSTRSARAMVPMLLFSVVVLAVAILVAMVQPGDLGGTKTATTPAAHEVPAAPAAAPAPAPAPAAPAPAAATPATPPASGGLAGTQATTSTTAPAAVLGNDIERTPSVEDPSHLAKTGGVTSFVLPLGALGLAVALYVLLRRTRPAVAATA